jgi:hypothetical protein
MTDQLQRLLDVDRTPAGRVEYYREILGKLKRRMVATMGTSIADILASHALQQISSRHPIARELGVEDGGVTFEAFKEVDGRTAESLSAACRDFIAVLFNILSELTGQVLTDGWLRDVEGETTQARSGE